MANNENDEKTPKMLVFSDNLGVLVVCFGGPIQQKIHTPWDMDLLYLGIFLRSVILIKAQWACIHPYS